MNVRKSRISAIMKTGDWFDVWRQIFSKEGTRIERIHFHKKNLTWVQTTSTFTVFSKNPLRSSLTWYATYYMSCDHMYPYHPVNSVKAYRIRRIQYLKRWQSDNFIQKLKNFRRIWTIKNWCILLGLHLIWPILICPIYQLRTTHLFKPIRFFSVNRNWWNMKWKIHMSTIIYRHCWKIKVLEFFICPLITWSLKFES